MAKKRTAAVAAPQTAGAPAPTYPSMTTAEAVARARPHTLERRLALVLASPPEAYRDLCVGCGAWFERPAGSDVDVCLRCVGDDHDTVAELQSDLDEANGKLAEAEGFEGERDEALEKAAKAEDRADDVVKALVGIRMALVQARAAMALPEDAPHDHPHRRVLDNLDEAICACDEHK